MPEVKDNTKGKQKMNLAKEKVVEVEDLIYTYPGKNDKTLKNLDFNIKRGEIFGFLGPSGAGKSTTQKIINGILQGFQGQVRVMGKNIEHIDNSFYEKIGVSFELPNLYERFTGKENLDYFASLYEVETMPPLKLLEMVGLEEAADIKVGDYSKGMKMRLNLCRAFLNKPELLFLDEPTSGLDPGNAHRVKDIIQDYCQGGRTVFLTTHDMKAVDDLCHRVAFIVEGKIVLIDEPQKLKKEYGSSRLEVVYERDRGMKEESFPLAGLGNNQEFWQILQEHDPESVHSQEADLEQVFIEVTGRKLR